MILDPQPRIFDRRPAASKPGRRTQVSKIKNSDLTPGSSEEAYVRQPRAFRECRVPDADYAVGDRDAGQADARPEGIGSDVGDAVRDCDADQAGAAREYPVSNAVNAQPLKVQ